MYIFKFFVLIVFIFSSRAHDNFCPADKKESCLQDIDDKLYEEYYKAIKNAEKNYEECTAKNCQCFKNTILRDLNPFKEQGINADLIEHSKSRGIIYQIINRQLYRQKDCMFPSRCAGIEYFILKVIANMSNSEFVINTRDYPQSSKHFRDRMAIFSFSKTPDYFDIMYPAWSFWEGGPAISLYPRGLGRWDQHRVSLDQTEKKVPWEKKENKAFFRGSRTSSERDNLVLLSRKRPDIVDAQYTKNQAWKSNEDTLHMPPASEVSLENHCKYKYLFNYRGVAASFRHKHLFLCNSVIFHVGDEWSEFYYDAMKPWIHYIPVPSTASQHELKRLINFAKSNDFISRKIAQRGRDFIWNKLKMRDVQCYWESLLNQYSKILKYKPTLRNDVIKIQTR